MPSVGLVGGRGYVGQEIIGCLAQHPSLELTCVASHSLAGQPMAREYPQWSALGLTFQPADPQVLAAHRADVWILALGNGEAKIYADRFLRTSAKILDVSADFRCDNDWQYGLTEFLAPRIAASRCVANPGCYATGVQFALWPIREFLSEPALAFGVSGYSGAGRTPSPRNDPQKLADNLVPYNLAEHSHELEIERHLGRRVRLLPHVASFFRGLSLTVSFQIDRELTIEQMNQRYREQFAGQPFLIYDEAIPEIRQVRNTPLCRVGGLQRDPRDARRWVIVAALDNLSKGAATQAIQNVNLMCGFEHQLGFSRD